VLREALFPVDHGTAGLKALETLPKFASADEASALTTGGLQLGTRVGPHELIRLSALGGMAEVWLARRADGAFKREVALKPLRSRLRSS
jgi:hypothetical protein